MAWEVIAVEEFSEWLLGQDGRVRAVFDKMRKMMAIPFDEILAKMSPEVQERAASLAAKLIARERDRQEIRESLARSQAHVAQALGVEPAAVSELERGADLYLSSLRKSLRAMGGDLEIIARFPGRPPVLISRFAGAVVGPAKRGRQKRQAKPKS